MSTPVPVSTYKVFVDKLFERFCAKEFNKENPKPDKIVDVWRYEILHEGKKIEATKLRFGAGGLYFYNLKPAGTITTGNIQVNSKRLSKALLYIEDEENNSKYQQSVDWDVVAKTLLKKFEGKNSSATNESSKDLDSHSNDKFPIELVTPMHKIPEISICKGLIETFFTKIISRNYLDSWNILSPEYKKQSIWKESFLKFKNSCNFIDAIKVESIEFVTYTYGKLNYKITYDISYKLFDFKTPIIITNDFGWKIMRSRRIDLYREIISIIDTKVYNYYKVTPKKSLRELLNKDLLQECYFQRFIVGNAEYDLSRYKDKFNMLSYSERNVSADFCLKFIYGRWVIDDLSVFEPYYLSPHLKPLKRKMLNDYRFLEEIASSYRRKKKHD